MIRVINPATEELVREVAVPTEAEVEAALERAARCRPGEGERMDLLARVHSRLADGAAEAAATVTAEQGKPRVEALTAEVFTGLDHLRFALRRGRGILGFSPSGTGQALFAAKRQDLGYGPRGTVLLISPWNYPFAIPFIQTVQAVAAGNAVLLKCAPSTPLSAALIEALFRESGAPEGLVQSLPLPPERSAPLVTDPRVRAVVFTGSTRVGRQVATACAERLKPCVLELGGKDPAVVLADADLKVTIPGILWGGLMNAGQTCASIERIYVERKIYPRFLERLTAACRDLQVGDPRDPATQIGPMTLPQQRAKVDDQVRAALAAGARAVCGGAVPEGRGWFYPPTILTDVDHRMEVMREETFGPVLPVMPFDSEEEAVALANDCAYGLTASVWTTSPERAERLAGRLEAGAVTVNDHINSFAEPAAPWHGVKASGLGATHGPAGLRAQGERRFRSFDFTSRPRAWWYPYDEKGLDFFTTAVTALHGRGWPKWRSLLGLTASPILWTRAPWVRVFLKPWNLF